MGRKDVNSQPKPKKSRPFSTTNVVGSSKLRLPAPPPGKYRELTPKKDSANPPALANKIK